MLNLNFDKNRGKSGFALFYVLIIIGMVLIATSTFLESALGELFLSADREDSDTALYMAESGIECVLYHQNKYEAMKTLNEQNEYRCDEETVFQLGWGGNDYSASGVFINNEEGDSCMWREEGSPLPVFGVGLNHADYDGIEKRLIDTYDAIVLKSQGSDACAMVTIEIEPLKDLDLNMIMCDVHIRSRGASECDDDGFPIAGAVERTRVESMEF